MLVFSWNGSIIYAKIQRTIEPFRDVKTSDVELVIGQNKDSCIQNWFSDLDNSAKLQCYRSFKSYFEP